MSVLQRDPRETAATIERWLRERQGLEAVSVTDIDIPAATGWSNETIMARASWRDPGGTRERDLVVRVAPRDYTVFPDDTFVSQFRLMQALGAHSDVPAATVHWFDDDPSWLGNPFWVMDRVEGSIATDTPAYAASGWLFDASPADQARAWWSGVEAMARVHRVDPAGLGVDLSGFRDDDGSVDAHLDHLQRFLDWAEDGVAHDDARRGLEVLRATTPRTASGPLGLCWGDARLSNLIYRDFEVVAVLDWEMAGLGDPLVDLGWWLFADATLTAGSGCERLPGFPGREATAARWAELTGRDPAALDWWELYAGVWFAVIMLRMGALLHGMGLVDADFPRSNFISRAMATMADRY